MAEQLSYTPAQISILTLLQTFKNHQKALIRVLKEAYVPTTITGEEMAHVVR